MTTQDGGDNAGQDTQNASVFGRMLAALAQPRAFPTTRAQHAVGAAAPFEVVQTHASAVLLAGDRAYKLKKPNDFGFFDYSTPALRRHFCSQEVRLNSRLAPAVYLGVAPVVELPTTDEGGTGSRASTEGEGGSYRFAETVGRDALDTLPLPGDTVGPSSGDGCVVDYAVVMRRLPEASTLAARVAADDVRPELLAGVAGRVAAFHAASRSDEAITHFGSLEVITHNWEENFAQMAPYVGRALDQATFDRISTYVRAALRHRSALFAQRQRDGHIRDCHGDLRMQHIYILDHQRPESHDGSDAVSDGLAIIDCIEFNERFRYGDVAGEVAFLTMELDAAGRPDLARAFVDAYVARTGDVALRELLPFYACYRACVRGKVLAFQLDEHEVPPEQREAARREAHQLFELAARYASAPAAPVLLLVGGLMGTGKSTLAQRLAHELGGALLASDSVRKELADLDPAAPQATAFGQGIYTPDWSTRTYQTLWERAAALLAGGRSVILDASFARRADRLAAAAMVVAPLPAGVRIDDPPGVSHDRGATAWFVECVCPRDVARARLAQRWSRRQRQRQRLRSPGHVPTAGTAPAAEAGNASDGRPELYDAQAAAWQPYDAPAEAALRYLRVDTGDSHAGDSHAGDSYAGDSHAGTSAGSAAEVLDALEIEALACWR